MPGGVCSGASAEPYPSKYPGFAVFPPGHSRWKVTLPLRANFFLFVSSVCGRTKISPAHLVCFCFFFFLTRTTTQGRWAKQKVVPRRSSQEIHSFSSTNAPCFVPLSRAESKGVSKSQTDLGRRVASHMGETSGIIFFLISNMLALQDLERMAHHA